jgi:hypothetical protein
MMGGLEWDDEFVSFIVDRSSTENTTVNKRDYISLRIHMYNTMGSATFKAHEEGRLKRKGCQSASKGIGTRAGQISLQMMKRDHARSLYKQLASGINISINLDAKQSSNVLGQTCELNTGVSPILGFSYRVLR